jgi:RNA polymerase sigma factor for flagellar operon FliA
MSAQRIYQMVQTLEVPRQDREALIEDHLPQVRFMAERIAAKLPRWVELDDLIGAGMLGLLDAVDKFDPSRGVKFKTYAELRIRGAILDSLRDVDWAPRSLRRRAREVEAAYAQLEAMTGSATDEQVASFLNLSLAEFHQLLQDLRSLTITNLDSDEDDDNRPLLSQNIGHHNTPGTNYETTEIRQNLVQAIDRLPQRQREVVALYYVEELTMKEVGAALGVTESRVSQIHTQAVLKLRSSLHSLRPQPALA